MISTPVRVLAVKDRVAQVVPSAQSGCGGCASRESCGVSGLGRFFASRRKAVELPCDAAVRAGDEMQVQMRNSDLLKAGLLAYLLPCVLALVGAGALQAYGDIGAVLGAGIGAVAGFLVARLSGWAPRVVVGTSSIKGETA